MTVPSRGPAWTLALVLLAGALSLAACGGSSGGQGSASGTPSAAATPAPSAPGSHVNSSPPPGAQTSPVPALSVRQLAGQRVVYSYHGPRLPSGLLRRVRTGQAAGVIFFGGNISSRAQIRGVIGRLEEAAAQSPVKTPLLLMVDQEGGLVSRLPGAPLPSQKQIGLSADPDSAARRAGRAAGLGLEGVGMNVNLAPVLDVYRTRGGFIDRYGRSYSADPRVVARLGAGFITAQQRAGVAATAKHFPGLGSAARAQDTDVRAVTLRVPLATLRAVDELPYQRAIAARVRLVMVSWATYPALDARRPAGLSRVVVEEELRRRLGFTGVTITDSIGAAGLSAYGATGDRAVLAAGAGMDLLLCAGRRVTQGTAAVTALAGALDDGRLGRKAFAAAVERVLALRGALRASTPPAASVDSVRRGIAPTLRAYFAAINARDFGGAWEQFTPSLRRSISVEHLKRTLATTRDFAVVIREVTPIDARTAVVYVTFTSTQDASRGPDGDTRDDWTLDYTMKLIDGVWLIDSVSGHNGSTHRTA